MFSLPIEKCDVQDKAKLTEFRKMAASWHQLLHNDAEHSVLSQYSNMMWQDAAWRMANEARRYAFDDGPSAAINPILGKLIDHGYAMGQIISLSRLLERSDPDHPKKAVVSIRRIVDEMYDNRALFTREIFVANDKIPYDWIPTQAAAPNQWVEPTGANGSMMASLMHVKFDKLSGISSNNRSRTDQIPETIFQRLKDMLDDSVFDEIKNLRNKSVAHAADAYSRSQIANLRKSLKFSELEKAHHILTGVIQSVSMGLLFGYQVGTSVPREQPEAFEHFDKPFIDPSRKKEFYRFWCAHSEEREGWLTDAFKATLPELAT
jgi:hypothetical protein